MNKIKKVKSDLDIVSLDDKPIITINKSHEKITIFDDNIVANIFEKKFHNRYRELLYFIMTNVSDDEETTADHIALIKIDELSDILRNKYSKHLSPETVSKYLKMLAILEQKVRKPLRGYHR